GPRSVEPGCPGTKTRSVSAAAFVFHFKYSLLCTGRPLSYTRNKAKSRSYRGNVKLSGSPPKNAVCCSGAKTSRTSVYFLYRYNQYSPPSYRETTSERKPVLSRLSF